MTNTTNLTETLDSHIARLQRHIAKCHEAIARRKAILETEELTDDQRKGWEDLISHSKGEIHAFNIAIQELTAIRQGY